MLSKAFVFRIYNFIFSLPTNSKTELVFVGSVYTKTECVLQTISNLQVNKSTFISFSIFVKFHLLVEKKFFFIIMILKDNVSLEMKETLTIYKRKNLIELHISK